MEAVSVEKGRFWRIAWNGFILDALILLFGLLNWQCSCSCSCTCSW